MISLEENILKAIGINKNWFSRTTRYIPMISCIYFTATRNITVDDVIHVFENILNIGMVYKEYINIVPVLNKNYNHIFLKIQWNDTIETANFVNELVVNSSIKVHHNKGYWVCRMSKNPLKLRHSKRCVKIASFYCDDSSSSSCSESHLDSESQEQNVQNITIQVKEIEAIKEVSNEEDKVSNEEDKVSNEEEEDFYVIKEEVKEEINSIVE